jgi:predicted ribosome quality control (RQC) complex YloA/Tae2 family protein
MLLRKHLTGATLIGVEQPLGERMVDFVFSCLDEVSAASIKILTAEIMGRHSNLIFWDKTTEKIICASHVVTKEMSRQREVAPGLRFERPPGQDKANIFAAKEDDFIEKLEALRAAIATGEPPVPPFAPTIEQWLINLYTGLGRHLAAELVAAAKAESVAATALEDSELKQKLWSKILELQAVSQYSPAMKSDLSAYSVLSWWPDTDQGAEWKKFPSANDMVDEYYGLVEAREHFNQLRERLRSELRGESEKLESRISAASAQLGNGGTLDQLKRSGDLILANLNAIAPGQGELSCEDLYAEGGGAPVIIKLNPNMSPAQNAQSFYRQFAKSRARQNAATTACREATSRLEQIQKQLSQVESASDSVQLRQLKEQLLGRKPQEGLKQPTQQPQKKKNKSRLLSITSSDGWTIYVGRNRQENDYLLSRLAQPNDLWLHIQGQGGAHVLIRVPASKQEPPLNTIKEAAQVAARLSKAAAGTKQRVVYTQCKYVKKVSKDKPGVVRYENERTVEVDTAQPMPKCMKQLFQQ